MSINVRTVEKKDDSQVLREIQTSLDGLRFGSVEITVHNGQVVQIERKEKIRLTSPNNHS